MLTRNRHKALMRWRHVLIAVYHVIAIAIALVTGFLLRFDFAIPPRELGPLFSGLALALPVKLVCFQIAGLHKGWWRYAGVSDLVTVLVGNLGASAALTVSALWFIGPSFPRSVYLIDFLVCFLATCGGRLAVRVYNEAVVREVSKQKRKGLLIYGAGMAGATLVREIRTNPSLRSEVLGLVDDDRAKRGERLMGVRVLGTGRDLPHIVERLKKRRKRVEEVVIAMPSATGRQMREALANCRAANVVCKTIPGLSELLSGQVLTAQIRNVGVTDLLGREPVRLEEDKIRSHIAGKVVMVTGAAGSIGSEICRQVADFGPSLLIAADQAESDLYRIELELRGRFPSVKLDVEIADIRDPQRIEQILSATRVDTIFHAAAYKHVPMMELHVLEAVKNNVIGTWNLVQAAHRHGVADFLMISSDKAVNPTSIMGATKRVAEHIVSSMPAGGTRYVSVRFGNVLGSNGSVVPLFQAQIAAGGPVTVTHPEVRRYFMTIREAVQLVLQASTMGKGSEVFLLDMGEPIRIADLARNMIRLAGRVPEEEIEIRFTGLRPGEKLFEELTAQGENIRPTYHEKIKIFKGQRESAESLRSWLEELRGLVNSRNAEGARDHLQVLVPEYKPEVPAIAARPGVLRVRAAG